MKNIVCICFNFVQVIANVWSMSSSYNSFNTFINQGRHGSDLIFKLLHVLSREDATSASCVLWSIWKQKNNKIWNDVIHAQP